MLLVIKLKDDLSSFHCLIVVEYFQLQGWWFSSLSERRSSWTGSGDWPGRMATVNQQSFVLQDFLFLL